MTPAPAVDLSAVRQKLETLEAIAQNIAALDAQEAEIGAAEPPLLERAAAGDVQSATKLTMARLKREVIPNERAKLKASKPDLALAVWNATSAGIDESLAAVSQTLVAVGDEINATLRPHLETLLLPNSIPNFATLANKTALGLRAEHLEHALKALEADYPRRAGVAPWNPNGRTSKEQAFDEFQRLAIWKGKALLDAWAEFEKGE